MRRILSFDPSANERFPSGNAITRFILSVDIVTELDMTCKKDRERLQAMFNLFKRCLVETLNSDKENARKKRAEAIACNVTAGDAPHLDPKEIEEGREKQKSFLAKFHDNKSLVDCNKSSVQVDKDGNFMKIVEYEHVRKAMFTLDTPLLEDDGKEEGTGVRPGRDKLVILDDVRSEEDFPRLAQEIERLSNIPNGPSVIVAAMYLCKSASQESVFKLEELVQHDVLSNEETRHTSLNDDNYHQGSKSTRYSNYAIACCLLMKGAIKAVLDGKLYFSHYICPDLKDRLRLMFPQLEESKYWRREASNAKEREAEKKRQRKAAKRAAKKQNTA